MASSTSASASALPTTGIYEPLLPPWHPVSDDDRSAYAFLAPVVLIVITGLTVTIKLQMTASTFRKLRLDDYALIAALIFALGYTIAITRATSSGLGRVADNLSRAQVEALSQAYYASNILLYPSLAASKASVALLVIAIKPKRWVALALYAVLAISLAWCVAAVLVSAFQCGPTRWVLGPTGDDTCIDQYAAQIGLKLVDILTDVALAVLPAAMMSTVQTAVDKRLIVAFMFGLRLATPAFTAVLLARLSDFYSTPTADRAFHAVAPAIWTSVVLNASLITACLPSIKRWLTDWAAGVANAGIMEPYEIQASSGHGHSQQGGDGPSSHSGLRSFVRSRNRGTNNMSSKGRETPFSSELAQERDHPQDDGDSKKGLTDGILQTVDYRVDYDDERHGRGRDY